MKTIRHFLALFLALVLPLSAAQQTINVGSSANDGTGDGVRTAFGKVNSNFTEIYTGLATSAGLRGLIGDETGTGALVFGTSPTIAGPTITGTLSLGSGVTLSAASGSTTTINGALGGTPTGGTLNLAALTLTLPTNQFLTTPLLGSPVLAGTTTIQTAGTLSLVSGATATLASGSSISIGGVFGGTPTGGTLNLSNLTLDLPTVPVGDGGTGATTASGARTNLGATTAGANLFTLTNPSAITFLRINADNTVTARTAAQMRSDLALAGEVYVGPSGNDSNAGTYAAPLATLDAAVTALGGRGTIWMLAGTYTGSKLNLANAKKITLAGMPGTRVKVFHGTAIAAGSFAAYTAGGETHTWRAALATVPDTGVSGARVEYVYESDTPRYAIADADRDPAWGTATHELEHYPLPVQTSIANVEAASAGGWYVSGGYLYVRTSTGTAPTTTIYVPDNSGTATKFLYGASATAQTEITVQGIETYFGDIGADVSNVGKATFIGFSSYGNRTAGILATSAGSLHTRQCRISAGSNDGIVPEQTDFAKAPLHWLSEGDRVVRMADKGFVAHQNVNWHDEGSFGHANAVNFMAFAGANATLIGSRSRSASSVGFSLYPDTGIKGGMTLLDIVSDGDSTACENGGAGWLLRVINSVIRNAGTGPTAQDATGYIEISNTSIHATTRLGGNTGAITERTFTMKFAGGTEALPGVDVGGSSATLRTGMGTHDGVDLSVSSNGSRVFYANPSFLIFNRGIIPVGNNAQTLGADGNRWSENWVGKLDASGTIKPGSMADAAAGNGTIYYSTDAAKLVFKDAGGTVHALY